MRGIHVYINSPIILEALLSSFCRRIFIFPFKYIHWNFICESSCPIREYIARARARGRGLRRDFASMRQSEEWYKLFEARVCDELFLVPFIFYSFLPRTLRSRDFGN